MRTAMMKAALSLTVVLGTLSAAQSAHADNIPGYFIYQNRKDTSYCMGVAAGDVTNGRSIIVWKCNGNIDQDWGQDLDDKEYLSNPTGWYYSYRNATNTNKCLGVRAGSTARGTPLMIWDCETPRTSHQDQFWHLVYDTPSPCMKFWDARTNMIASPNGPVANGTPIVMLPDTGAPEQEWCPFPVTPGQ